jgi:hypothetical protein
MTTNPVSGHLWKIRDFLSKVRLNAKTIATLTGAEIAALTAVQDSATSLYPFDGNGDDVIGSNHLTGFGTPTFVEGGPFGNATNLNGVDQYWQTANNTIHDVGEQDFSIITLAKFDSFSTIQSLFSKRNEAADINAGYNAVIGTAGQILVRTTDTTTATVLTTFNVGLTTGKWYIIGFSWDRDANLTIRVYDTTAGTLSTHISDISSVAGSLTNAQTFTFGRRSATSTQFGSGERDHTLFIDGTDITEAQFLAFARDCRPGMTVDCTKTENGFIKNHRYKRNVEGTACMEMTQNTAIQTLINKTINATNNTITDTSQAAEDLLRNNGSKFVRFAKGSKDTYLSTNLAGALAYRSIFGSEIARTTLGSAASTITVDNIPARKQYMVIVRTLGTAAASSVRFTFNNDTGSNYAHRRSESGAAETTAANASNIATGASGDRNFLMVIWINNQIATNEKNCYYVIASNPAAGAANIPARVEGVGKWANTANLISRLDIIANNNFAAGSEVVVYGSD